MIKLIFLSGPLREQRFAVERNATLGRDPSNDIAIPDPAVSLVHSQVYFEDGRAFIKDLGSTNGIRVNGQRVIIRQLQDGDGVGIGKSTIRIESHTDAGAPPSQPSTEAVPPTIVERPAGEAKATSGERGELSGSIFGSVAYLLKRKIADGGMGAVYEAEQFGAEGFIKSVAIKTILPSFVRKKSFVSSFIGEARLVANLVHPNIVQIHHFGRHENGYYIAMEYIDGIDLARFLEAHRRLKRQVPVETALFIMDRVCLGLDYAHGKRDAYGELLNLVHRDVSPSNIMLSRDGEVKLTDFGVAKAAEFMEDDDVYLVGSVGYMSPEQAACEAVDGRSDLFSLGLVGYELMTAISPLRQMEGDDVERAVERVKRAEIPDPRKYRPDLPAPVAEMLLTCLKKAPDRRYPSARALATAIEQELFAKGGGPSMATLARHLGTLPRV